MGKLKKLYWNEEADAIVTKGCADVWLRHKGVEEAISILGNRIKELQKQIACDFKGHTMVFKARRTDLPAYPRCLAYSYVDTFIFECSNCGMEIAKTESELTPPEKKALIELSLLKWEGK